MVRFLFSVIFIFFYFLIEKLWACRERATCNGLAVGFACRGLRLDRLVLFLFCFVFFFFFSDFSSNFFWGFFFFFFFFGLKVEQITDNFFFFNLMVLLFLIEGWENL